MAISESFAKQIGSQVVRGKGLRIGVQIIAQWLGRSITAAAIEQLSVMCMEIHPTELREVAWMT